MKNISFDRVIRFRARDELVEAVKEAAAAEDTTPSEWWRRLALDRLEGQGAKLPTRSARKSPEITEAESSPCAGRLGVV